MNAWVTFWAGMFVVNVVFIVTGDIPLISTLAAALCAIMAGVCWENRRG